VKTLYTDCCHGKFFYDPPNPSPPLWKKSTCSFILYLNDFSYRNTFAIPPLEFSMSLLGMGKDIS